MEVQTRSPPEVSVSERLRVLGRVGIRRVAVLQVQNRVYNQDIRQYRADW